MRPLYGARNGSAPALVRPFDPQSDLESCIEIYYQTRRETFRWVPRPRFKRSDFLLDTVEEQVFVVELNGAVVAFAGLCVPERFLHHLYVRREYQGQGVGSLLLQEVLRASGGLLRLKCLCKNKRALAFYRRRGWREGEKGRDAFGRWVLMESPRSEAPRFGLSCSGV